MGQHVVVTDTAKQMVTISGPSAVHLNPTDARLLADRLLRAADAAEFVDNLDDAPEVV